MGIIKLIIDTNAKEVSSQFEAVANNTKKATKGMGVMGQMGKKLAVTLGATAGLSKVMSFMTGTIQKATTKAFEFTDGMTKLLSLGDNLDNFIRVRDAVEQMAISTGFSSAQIQDAFFNIQSGGSQLADSIQRDLVKASVLATKVLGGDMATNVQAATKSMNIFGDDVGDVTTLMNKLAFIADKGETDMGRMANVLGKLGSNAKGMGYDLDQMGAAFIATTGKLGSNEEAATALINTFKVLERSVVSGAIKGKTLADQLEDLARIRREQGKGAFLEIVPDVRARLGIEVLLQNMQMLRDITSDIQNLDGNRLQELYDQRVQTDRMFRAREKHLRLEQEIDQVLRNSWMANEGLTLLKMWEAKILSGMAQLPLMVEEKSAMRDARRNESAAREILGTERQIGAPMSEEQQMVTEGLFKEQLKHQIRRSDISEKIRRTAVMSMEEAAERGVKAGMAASGDNPNT